MCLLRGLACFRKWQLWENWGGPAARPRERSSALVREVATCAGWPRTVSGREDISVSSNRVTGPGTDVTAQPGFLCFSWSPPAPRTSLPRPHRHPFFCLQREPVFRGWPRRSVQLPRVPASAPGAGGAPALPRSFPPLLPACLVPV